MRQKVTYPEVHCGASTLEKFTRQEVTRLIEELGGGAITARKIRTI